MLVSLLLLTPNGGVLRGLLLAHRSVVSAKFFGLLLLEPFNDVQMQRIGNRIRAVVFDVCNNRCVVQIWFAVVDSWGSALRSYSSGLNSTESMIFSISLSDKVVAAISRPAAPSAPEETNTHAP